MKVKDNRKALIAEAYRLSEASLASDAAAADAGDQRSNSFSGLMVAASAVMATLFVPSQPNFSVLVAATVFLLSAGLSAFAARPRDFYFPGAKFSDFEDDLTNDVELDDVLRQMGAFNDAHSTTNRAQLKENAKLMLWSYRTAMLAAIIAIISQAIMAI